MKRSLNRFEIAVFATLAALTVTLTGLLIDVGFRVYCVA
jgi:hypothetical protein